MIFNGIHKTSLVNYPGKVCTVLFTSGCNLKCGYCYNGDLVNRNLELEEYSEEDILSILTKRKKLIDAVTITGGEPTIYKGLPNFIKKLKIDLGFDIKLDTNGFNPEMISELLQENLLDMVALDIKTSPEKYPALTGVKVDFNIIIKTLDIIKKSGIDYELRTTAVPGYFSLEDIKKIKDAIGHARNYHIQQFIPENTMEKSFSDLYPFKKEELSIFKESILDFCDNCSIRGI